jgi:hypothetical protein
LRTVNSAASVAGTQRETFFTLNIVKIGSNDDLCCTKKMLDSLSFHLLFQPFRPWTGNYRMETAEEQSSNKQRFRSSSTVLLASRFPIEMKSILFLGLFSSFCGKKKKE